MKKNWIIQKVHKIEKNTECCMCVDVYFLGFRIAKVV